MKVPQHLQRSQRTSGSAGEMGARALPPPMQGGRGAKEDLQRELVLDVSKW